MADNGNSVREGRRSVALWSKLKPLASGVDAQAITPKMELHFNYWRMRSSETSDIAKKEGAPSGDFLDVGIMVSGASRIEGIYVYIPTQLTQENVVDLGGLFSEPAIVTGIFNERLTTKSSLGSQQTWDLVRDPGGEFFCRVYRFALSNSGAISSNELKVEEADSGTVLGITQTALSVASRGLTDSNCIYFRIRVLLPKEDNNCFAKVIAPADRWLLSGFDAAEYIDFRLNEARNLPGLIEHRMLADEANGQIPIMRIDFLLVVRVAADLVGGHRAFHKSRLLEKELWASYVKNGTSTQVPEGMVIYHWRETSSGRDLSIAPAAGSPSNTAVAGGSGTRSIDDFSAFVKLRLRRSGGSIVWRYIFIVLIVGAIGGTLGNGLTTLVSKIPDMVWSSLESLNESKASTVSTFAPPVTVDQNGPAGRFPPQGSGNASPAKGPKEGR